MRNLLLSFLLFFSLLNPVFATTYYWDGDPNVGNDSNNCTSGSPCETFGGANPANVINNLQDGDKIHITNLVRPKLTSSAVFNGFVSLDLPNNLSNITVEGNSTTLGSHGTTHTAVVTSSWTNVSGTVYTTTITDFINGGMDPLIGLNIAAVAVDYGQHRNDLAGNPTVYTGFLRLAATALDVVTTVESYFYEPTTALLTINSSKDPSINQVIIALNTDDAGITSGGCDNCLVKDLRTFITGFGSTGSGGGGYGVLFQGSSNTTYDNILCDNGGYHCLGYVGSVNSGNRIQNSFVYGATNTTHTQTIFFSDGDDVTGARINNVYFSIYGPMDTLGVFHTGFTGVTGSYVHTSPDDVDTPRVADYEVTNSTYACVQDAASPTPSVNRGQAFGGADPLSMPAADSAAEKTYSSYNIRHSDIKVYGCRAGGGNSGSAVNNPLANYPGGMAIRRMFFDTTTIINPFATGTTWLGWGSTPAVGGNPKQSTTLCESCDFNFDLTTGGNFVLFFGATTDNSKKRMVFINPTIIDSVPRSGNVFSFAVNATAVNANGNEFVVHGMVYAKDHNQTRGLFTGNTSETNATIQSLLTVTNNWYYNSAGTLNYVNNTAASPNLDTQAEFSATIDPSGVYAVAPQFANAAVNGEPLAGGNLITTLNAVLTPTPGYGINGRPYGRNYGAYQYGVTSAGSFGAGNFNIGKFGLGKYTRGEYH